MLAAKLGFTPGRLSEYISGKRLLTLKQAEKIANRLGYDPERRLAFFKTVEPQRFNEPVQNKNADEKFRKLSADAFAVVADWQHFAILSLMDLDEFHMSDDWIAERIGISPKAASMAIKKLENVGLIARVRGRWQKIEASHTTTHDVPSVALRISHRQTLQQAADALDDVPIELRDITSMTMAIDLATLPQAKQLIRSFRRRLSGLMETGSKTEVYNLNIQLVPVTKIKKIKEGYEN
jgi:uncharacterized protein (TIGR02147 family)